MRIFLLLGVILVLLFFPQPVTGGSALWQPVAPGIEYREFYLEDGNKVYVARMNRDNPGAILESSIGRGKLSGGGETVKDMAARYDGAINYWGGEWGTRNQVAVAINGYFFDTETGVPKQGQLHSGWYTKRFDNLENGSGIVWTMDRNFFVGGCITHRPSKQIIYLPEMEEEIPFDGINQIRQENDLIIYTAHYDASTLTDDKGSEILVELDNPMFILPSPEMVTGTVREIRTGKGSTPIPFDHVVISVFKKGQEKLIGKVNIGDQIGISQELTHFKSDCNTPNPYDWTKTYASIGGSFHFLQDGIINPSDDLGSLFRKARTAVASNERYIYFVVVNSRDPFTSGGMSIVELAAFVRNFLGASSGVALDGGGSSTMVVNGDVKNKSSAPGSLTSDQERVVANGFMMVVVTPKELSNRYKSGDSIQIVESPGANIRSGPGTNYSILNSAIVGSRGTVLKHNGRLNGVFATDSYWWKIQIGDLVGWIAEELITHSAG